MFFPRAKSSTTKYAPLAAYDDNKEIDGVPEKSSLEADNNSPLLKASDNINEPSKPSRFPRGIFCLSFILALLSAANLAVVPATLSKYDAYFFSDSEVQALPYDAARLGLEKAIKAIPSPRKYHLAWPDRIARVSRKLKRAVWGHGVQVYISVEDSTVMRFPVPPRGTNLCALSWLPPPKTSARTKDVTIKGETTEIEAWQLIATSASRSPNMDELDYDTLSYSKLPVRGELLGVLDMTASPNSTTVEFACPIEAESLVIEMRCQRVACHVSFMQVEMVPRFGFALVREGE